MKVLGYFKHKNDKELNALTAMIFIQADGELTCYCGAESHNKATYGYLSECESITKEQYLEANKDYHTPQEYLI